MYQKNSLFSGFRPFIFIIVLNAVGTVKRLHLGRGIVFSIGV